MERSADLQAQLVESLDLIGTIRRFGIEDLMFYSLVGYVTTPISSLISSNSTIQEALIASDRLFQIMDLEQEEINNDKITLSTDMIGDICFDNVTFHYGSRKFVFDNFNLTIQKGRTTAVVDESDSGKTTLISLLQNIYPIQRGENKNR